MSNVPVTTQDLELEHAELLPSRETLNACCRSHPSSGFTQVAWGNGNTNQAGFLNISALNGNFSGNSIEL
jgi:hypothetical protein